MDVGVGLVFGARYFRILKVNTITTSIPFSSTCHDFEASPKKIIYICIYLHIDIYLDIPFRRSPSGPFKEPKQQTLYLGLQGCCKLSWMPLRATGLTGSAMVSASSILGIKYSGTISLKM